MAGGNLLERVFAKLAAACLLAGGASCLLPIVYVIYRVATGSKQLTDAAEWLFYVALPLTLATAFFASLRLHQSLRAVIALLCLSLAALAYGLELWLYRVASSPSVTELLAMPPAERSEKAAAITRQFGAQIDTRERYEVIADLKKQGIDAVPLLWKTGAPSGVLPLAGISNRVTVVCNQNGSYLTYKSDTHGFHNPEEIWNRGHARIATVGNSLTLGYCVPSDQNFVAYLRTRYADILNLGMAGQGPLHILAILREYAQSVKPDVVLWFYAEGSTFSELRHERDNQTLTGYLKSDFTQHLMERQSEVDEALLADIDKQLALERTRLAEIAEENTSDLRAWVNFAKLLLVRKQFSDLYGRLGGREAKAADVPLSEFELSHLKKDMPLLRDIVSRIEREITGWGGKLYFVYLPSWQRYARISTTPVKARSLVLQTIMSLGVPIIDVQAAFESHHDPLSLFPFRKHGHYNSEGHALVAQKVIDFFSTSRATPLR
jgi:hypothetical protein